jgi:hypothetical protein
MCTGHHLCRSMNRDMNPPMHEINFMCICGESWSSWPGIMKITHFDNPSGWQYRVRLPASESIVCPCVFFFFNSYIPYLASIPCARLLLARSSIEDWCGFLEGYSNYESEFHSSCNSPPESRFSPDICPIQTELCNQTWCTALGQVPWESSRVTTYLARRGSTPCVWTKSPKMYFWHLPCASWLTGWLARFESKSMRSQKAWLKWVNLGPAVEISCIVTENQGWNHPLIGPQPAVCSTRIFRIQVIKAYPRYSFFKKHFSP